jgi:hypothetical protein
MSHWHLSEVVVPMRDVRSWGKTGSGQRWGEPTRLTRNGHAQRLFDKLAGADADLVPGTAIQAARRNEPAGFFLRGRYISIYAALFAGAAPSIAPICFISVSKSK